MSPSIAAFAWFISLLALFRLDPAKQKGISSALWVPVIWLFIVGSRLPSQWLGGQMGQAASALEEGNPIDRTISLGLIAFAIGILASRRFKWAAFFSQNLALMALLTFALISVVWSDFPLITFKRWFRDLGIYLVILVVLSDPQPLEAVRTLLRRLCYLLIPFSVLLVKYYPDIGRQYDWWTGAVMYVGPTTSKNMLGVLCLVSGLFFFWDTIVRWPERKDKRIKRIIWVNVAFFAMTIYLLNSADSATSRVCLVLGCAVILAAQSSMSKRRPALIKVLIPSGLCLYLVLEFGFGFDLNAELAKMVGRNPNLTGRTEIWDAVLGLHTNSLVGTGYETFWLGPRLLKLWPKIGGINEAHNGYLEVYLNLGSIGLVLLVGFLIASYRTICKRLASPNGFGSLILALWTVLLFYNVTESAFKGELMWVVFLLGVIVVPEPKARPTAAVRRPLWPESPFKLEETASIYEN